MESLLDFAFGHPGLIKGDRVIAALRELVGEHAIVHGLKQVQLVFFEDFVGGAAFDVEPLGDFAPDVPPPWAVRAAGFEPPPPAPALVMEPLDPPVAAGAALPPELPVESGEVPHEPADACVHAHVRARRRCRSTTRPRDGAGSAR